MPRQVRRAGDHRPPVVRRQRTLWDVIAVVLIYLVGIVIFMGASLVLGSAGLTDPMVILGALVIAGSLVLAGHYLLHRRMVRGVKQEVLDK